MSRFAPLLLLALLGCPGDDTDTRPDTFIDVELVGPELSHTPVEGPVIAGTAIDIAATAVDETDGVFAVTLYYRTVDEPVFDTVRLDELAEGQFSGTIPGSQVQGPGLEYYLVAEDNSDFRVETNLPEEAADAPFLVQVDIEGSALPWSEDFEPRDGSQNLFGLGWTDASLGFAGTPWNLGTSRTHGGDYSAVQRPSAVGVPDLDNWLISPALKIEGEGQYEVSWYEYGDSVQLAEHSLWISSGSADPAEGDFIELAPLDAPREGGWARSRVVEIPSSQRGPAVYLAWRYVGAAADTWFLDDISVQDLGPDVLLDEVGWTPVDPGGTSTVSLSLRNGTRIAAEDLVISGSLAEGGSFGDPVTVTLDGDSSLAVDLALTVADTWPDNSRLPITLTATMGELSWSWQDHIVVGEPSSATISVDTFEAGLLQLAVGAGDIDAPSTRVPVTSEVVEGGRHTYTVDLTPSAAYLPPGPGDERWWVSVTSTVSSTLADFQIDFDGQTFASDDLGSPAIGATEYFFLPRPPEPVISGLISDPTPLEPGSSGTVTVSLANTGTPTTGSTQATLASLDSNVVFDSTPADLGIAWADPLDVDFGVDVLAGKVDALPVPVELTVTDQIESFVSRTELAVPWPVLQVQSIAIDDYDDGNDDELMDAGEQVLIDLTVSNAGTRATFGSLSCTVSQTSGPAATIVNGATSGVGFSTLDPGENDSDDDLEIIAPRAAVGTGLGFELQCQDDSQTYTTPFEVVIGERPWLGLSGANDARGDALNNSDFDLVNGQYRVQDDTLQLRFFSAQPYDPSTAFLELWMSSPGAEYTYYQVVSQSGVGSVRGYRFTFTPLSPAPVVTNVNETTLQIDLPLSTLDLAADRVELGVATGFCGGTAYFCDHFPNGWGDPYNAGLNTSVWLPITW